MKAVSLANRLSRDFSSDSFGELSADARLHMLDAINAALQRLNALSSPDSKKSMSSIMLPAPLHISIGVTNGSEQITGYTFTNEQLYRTIRIDGDGIDNQIVSPDGLMHPYAGQTGTVAAVIYADAQVIPEPYSELISDPRDISDRKQLEQASHEPDFQRRSKQIGRPMCYWVESNARNQNPPAPAIIRFHPMPSAMFRYEAWFTLAPARMNFTDLLSEEADVPLRDEEIESYMIPLARKFMTSSKFWRDKEEKANARSEANDAEQAFSLLSQKTVATPNNRVRTRPGY